MTCSPGISPNGSPLQKSPLPDSSTPPPALGFLTISLHTIDHQPRGAITFAHNGCRKLRAYAYDSSCLTVSTFNLGGHTYSASNLQLARFTDLKPRTEGAMLQGAIGEFRSQVRFAGAAYDEPIFTVAYQFQWFCL